MTENDSITSSLLTPAEAADWLRVSRSYLARLRVEGGGPPYIKLSPRLVVYRREDLESYVAERLRRSTSDRG